MESYLISDNHDTLVGLKMAGISGEILTEPHAIIEKMEALLEDPNIGMIIVTTQVKKLVESALLEMKMKQNTTLIVEVPGPNDTIPKDFITKYIRESIGLKL
ncbi:MAG: V-type ATP synthase subunit F [Clostridia bacterium]|nr:V-type ATP synthase subunit F [Clostridia bacterium]